MNVKRTEERFELQFSPSEKRLLFELLGMYPRAGLPLKAPGQPAPSPELHASERLLREALAEQRKENKKLVQAWLADPSRFKETATGSRVVLSAPEFEWLLQTLNDIRIGSWTLLGSPEDKRSQLNQETAPHFFAMELSGYFEMQLLEALEGET